MTDYVTKHINGSDIVYMKNGALHRDDGPALITETLQRWCINGQLHRIDGPAEMDKTNKVASFYDDGKFIGSGSIVDDKQWNKWWWTNG